MSDNNPYPMGSALWSARNTIDGLVQRSKEDEHRIRALEARLQEKEAEVARLNKWIQNREDAWDSSFYKMKARAEKAESALAVARELLQEGRSENTWSNTRWMEKVKAFLSQPSGGREAERDALKARLRAEGNDFESFRRWVQDNCSLLRPSDHLSAKGNIFTAFFKAGGRGR